MGALDGQVALVTGCSRSKGLGRAIALALASAGADMAVTDVVPEGTRNLREASGEPADWRGLDSVVDEIQQLGRRAAGLVGDVGLKADADRLVAEAVAALGQVDILVNNAAAPQGADRNWTWEVPEEAFDLQLRVNTKGVFLMSSAAIRHLLGRDAPGRIVNIASGAGKVGRPQRAAYCASKFAVIGLTQVMALELGSRGITVNAVCPGSIDTAREASRQGRQAAAGAMEPGARILSPGNPVGRLGTPAEVARVVAFLAEPASSWITGQSIHVNGGVILH